MSDVAAPAGAARLMRTAAQHVPLYREHWARARLNVESRAAPVGWASLPIIDKTALREAGIEARVDSRYRAKVLGRETTSGSSGEPLEFWVDRASLRRRRWRFLRALMWAGYRPGQRLLLISTHRTSKALALARWTYVDLRADEALLQDTYARVRPHVLYGPRSALLALAEQSTTCTPRHRPSVIISTAEQLRPADQHRLAMVFGVEPCDFYGMTETGLVAWRLAGSSAYCCTGAEIFTEFLPSDLDPGLERLVVTTLHDCAMPLLRYDTGDLVRRDLSRPGAPIVEFVGRAVDRLLLPSGKRLSPYRVTLALEAIGGIEGYRVVQQLDRSIEIRIRCTGPDPGSILEHARSAVAAIVGEDILVRASAMPERAPNSANKHRPVVSFASEAP